MEVCVLEEEKLRTVILGGSDEIFVICPRNGHGFLWKRLGELASWRVSEARSNLRCNSWGAANGLQSWIGRTKSPL